MKLEICKWYKDALAPVILMIDDFCNVWVDSNGNGIIEPGEDWGYAGRSRGSSLVFLEENLLKDFPELKVTFFVPVGIRAGVIANPETPYTSKKLNCDQETISFFRSVSGHPCYEMAYHGTTHGKPGRKAADFVQEWAAFASLEEAKETIQAGREIFKEVFGAYPTGGKYCGYISNDFSDDSIEQSGFSWWCRYDNIGLAEYKDCLTGGKNRNPLTNFDIKYFGSPKVVDIPTTLHGSLFTGFFHPGFNLKGILKRILKPLLIKKKLKKLDFLLSNRLVISIQEHISPARVDGRRQMPNIFDDCESLRLIMQYLEQKRVWYCTCSELARYVGARDAITIGFPSENSFNIRLKSSRAEDTILTFRIYDDEFEKIVQPDGTEINIVSRLADIKVMNGLYKLTC